MSGGSIRTAERCRRFNLRLAPCDAPATPPLTALILLCTVVAACFAARAQQPANMREASDAAAKPVGPRLAAKEIQGLDVFGTDGQQLGKVTKVHVIADGKVKNIEVRSRGFLGFFANTYIVPAETLNKKGGRLDLSMTCEQAKRFKK